MGKRIIQQARGHGSLTYRVRKQAYKYRIGYPIADGKGNVIDIINSPAHSAPLSKIMIDNKIFYIPAAKGIYVGQEIAVGKGKNIGTGDILMLDDIPIGTKVFNIESVPYDGGKLVRTAGSFATITKKHAGSVALLMSSKKEALFDGSCRATIGEIAGFGRIDKPIVKAGKKHHMMKARNKFWPRTSAVKMNAVDHPFGSGRGKRIKSKIAKRNAPPGAKVGLIRPRRTGRRKR
ncbi:50S ribosomal protein L2 [Candidatus Pacearchaeota archaeon]|nr:50S ribosomal protein L2 [Candidatus Pacearchaeota archaeon]